MRKRCWDSRIGNKTRILCNNDTTSKRKLVQRDVYQHLEGCDDAVIDGKVVRQVDADATQYRVQSGIVKNVRCLRRARRSGCRRVSIQKDTIQVCTDDPLEKKIDVMDTVDSVLMGCGKGQFGTPDGKTFTMSKPRAGLDVYQRNHIAREVVRGQVTHVRCVKRVRGK